jgi:hypothetical protein
MGQSTDGKIAFGFDLGDELPEKIMTLGTDERNDYFDEDTFWQNVAGLKYPDDSLKGEIRDKALKKFWKTRDEAKAKSGVEFVMHCSCEYAMYFLAVSGTEQSANRGETVPIKLTEISTEQISQLKVFCEKYDIDWQEPCWQLFSLWC